MNKVLTKQYIGSCTFILIMIIASLYFNILALTTPFLTIHRIAESNEIYSLFGAVKLMWGYKLYLIAILIVGFSIIFPFVKLIALFNICFVIKKPKVRLRIITIIEALAKWSMLDIFVVCILLVLTNNQIFISSEVNIGVYYFLLAIFISIVTAMLVDSLCEKTYPVSYEKVKARRKFIAEKFTVFEKAATVILLLTSMVFFIFAISDNYIQVSDFFLNKNSYSIIQTCLSLNLLSPILALFLGFVLIIFPFTKFFYMLLFWTIPYHSTFHIKISKLILKLPKVMMLDVFCLALLLFLMEGNIIILTESRTGLYMLVLYVFISLSLPLFIKYYARTRYYFYKKHTS